MVSTKYTKDYRLDNVLDPKSGKLVTRTVYVGDWYGFIGSKETVRRAKILLPTLSGLTAVLFLIGVLLPGDTPVYHGGWFVTFPFALTLIPIWLMCAASWRLLRAPDRFERFYRDKLGRFSVGAVIALVTLGLSLALHIVHWIVEGERGWDWVLLIATVLMLAAALLVLLNSGLAATTVVGRAEFVPSDISEAMKTDI